MSDEINHAPYAQEFPEFGDLDIALPAGFVDTSWHNDACPSFERQLPSGQHLRIYADYADAEKRDVPTAPRFSLHRLNSDRDYIGREVSTDEWAEILRAVERETRGK